MHSEFSWGDEVQVVDTAPARYSPGRTGSICGIRSVSGEALARFFDDAAIGQAIVYIVEFPDGTAVEIPEVYLSPDLTP